MNTNENTVVALFENQAAADAAIARLLAWDKASKDVKLGVIGKVYLENGEVKTTVQSGGGLFKRSVGLSDEQLASVGRHLEGDRVAVTVTSDDYEVSLVRINLEAAGGVVGRYQDPYDAEEKKAEVDAGYDAAAIKAFEKGTDPLLDIIAANKTGFN